MKKDAKFCKALHDIHVHLTFIHILKIVYIVSKKQTKPGKLKIDQLV